MPCAGKHPSRVTTTADRARRNHRTWTGRIKLKQRAAERRCRRFSIALGGEQCFPNPLFVARLARQRTQSGLEVAGGQTVRRRQNERALQHVGEFAHVAGPGRLLEARHRRVVDLYRRLAELRGQVAQQGPGQQSDVLTAIVERRQRDGEHLQAIEQVAESAPVVAPETNQSGASHSLSLHEPLRMRQVDDRAFAVRGTPTDCVIMGVRHVLKDAVPDLLAIFEQEWPKITTSRQPDGKKVQLVLDIVKVLGKIKDSRAVAPLLKLTQVYVGYKQNHILADLVIKTFGNLGPAAKDAIPVLAERIWTTASGFVIPWDDLICEAAKQFEPSLWGRIVSECEYYAALRNTKVTLVSPADVTSFERVATDPNSSAAVTFQWQIEKQIPRATYCSVLYTDKGSNPFDFGYEEAFNVGKATRATLKLGNIRYGNIFEWGVRVWACRDSNVDCKEPSDLLESSSLLPSTCFHVATSNIRRWCMGCIRLKVNKADEKVNKADGVVVPIRKFVLPH